jgi:hypothetical protein
MIHCKNLDIHKTNVVKVTEKVGRKWALQSNVVVFLIGAILMTAATHQLSFICEYLSD